MQRLYGLDALRGIAALLVALSHYFGWQYGVSFYRPGIAVDFFFMLSGFIMARTYEPRIPRRFLWLRFKRLWLPAAFGTTIGLFTMNAPHQWYPVALLMLPILDSNYFAFNPPMWSLFCELFANALHGFFQPSTRVVLATMVICLPAYLIVSLDGLQPLRDQYTILEGLLRVIVAYGIGVLMWRRWGEKSFFHPLWTILLPVSVYLPAQASAFATMILLPIALNAGLSLKAGPVLRFAGRISYPLYAVHLPIVAIKAVWTPVLLIVATAAATYLDELRHSRKAARRSNDQS